MLTGAEMVCDHRHMPRSCRRHLSVWRTRAALVAAGIVLLGALAGCGATRGASVSEVEMWIPNSPGGGYDLTGRAAVGVLERDDIVGGEVRVTNILGAGGTVAMARLMSEAGNPNLMMIVGMGVVGSSHSYGADARPQDATALAQLVEEPEGVIVPADSPYRTIEDLVAAWTKAPGALRVGGGSALGGPDHLFPMRLAESIGIAPGVVRYSPYDGGGPLTSALLSGEVEVGFSGLAEFEGQIRSGELRVLATSGGERMSQAALSEVPTLTERGIDLVFTNWRGVVAPPGLAEDERRRLIEYLTRMRDSSRWERVLAQNGWTDRFRTGEEFEDFLAAEDRRVATTLKELNLL
jgi:putative tricarboxylic transport membrane protein